MTSDYKSRGLKNRIECQEITISVPKGLIHLVQEIYMKI